MSFPAAPLALADEDREELGRLLESGSSRLAERARIVLACADSDTGNSGVAAGLGLSVETLRKGRSRFAESGPAGLADGARPGRPKAGLVLTGAERDQLGRWARRAETSHALALRARIVLACAGGRDNKAVAAELRVGEHMVARWRGRFTRKRLEGLTDEPPPGRPPSILLGRVRAGPAPGLPMMPGMPERRPHDYARHGVTSLFAAFNIADGTVISELHRRHRHQEFLKFLKKIDKNVPAGLDVHLICDNYGTHKTPEIQAWLARHPRFRVHFTPTGSSWINQVERWFGYLTDKKIRRGVHKSVQALEADIRDWIQTWNQDPRPFAWTKTAEEILNSLTEYMAKISGSTH